MIKIWTEIILQHKTATAVKKIFNRTQEIVQNKDKKAQS